MMLKPNSLMCRTVILKTHLGGLPNRIVENWHHVVLYRVYKIQGLNLPQGHCNSPGTEPWIVLGELTIEFELLDFRNSSWKNSKSAFRSSGMAYSFDSVTFLFDFSERDSLVLSIGVIGFSVRVRSGQRSGNIASRSFNRLIKWFTFSIIKIWRDPDSGCTVTCLK